MNVEPQYISVERDTVLLNDARRCHALFGPPEIDVEQMLDNVASWLKAGGAVHGNPTKFQVRDGKY